MQTQSYMHVRKVGYVRGQLRNKISFDRLPAVKESSADDGTVLLKPLPAAPPAGHAVTDVKPVKRATVQSATKPKVHTQAPKIPRNTNGSAQCSALIIGMRKHACVGDKF